MEGKQPQTVAGQLLLDKLNPMRLIPLDRRAGMICEGSTCMPKCHVRDERVALDLILAIEAEAARLS